MAEIRPQTGSLGRTLKLYLVDGTPSGVITAELGVSSVRAVMASRTALPDLIKREEAARTGVYMLLGPDPNLGGRLLVYVGEGDQVGIRLGKHDGDDSKDFFTRAVFLVSKDENITKAHGRYLESRLIAIIKLAGRAKLVNGTEPLFKGLPEPEIADMERVLGEIDLILPVLGFDILRPVGQEMSSNIDTEKNLESDRSANESGPIFQFSESNTSARAREAGGEFVVLSGSLIRKENLPSCPEPLAQQKRDLIADGSLLLSADGQHLQLVRDIAFGSPSGAGRIVYGGNVNGRKYWRHSITNESYGEWRAKLVASS